MKCPFCSNLTNKVIDSRLSKEGDVIRRRRVCLECGKRFTTRERLEDDLPVVIKRDGTRQPFDRQKIKAGIEIACKKRPIPVDKIDKIVERVEKKVLDLGEKEVHSKFIGNEIMQELYKLDHVAYVRFASVYREFKDVNEFMNELKNLISRGSGVAHSEDTGKTKVDTDKLPGKNNNPEKNLEQIGRKYKKEKKKIKS